MNRSTNWSISPQGLNKRGSERATLSKRLFWKIYKSHQIFKIAKLLFWKSLFHFEKYLEYLDRELIQLFSSSLFNWAPRQIQVQIFRQITILQTPVFFLKEIFSVKKKDENFDISKFIEIFHFFPKVKILGGADA